MKRLLLLLFFIPTLAFSQNYIDLFKIGYSQNFNNKFEGTDSATSINSIDVDLTVPFKINENNAIVTGVLFSKNNLDLYPEQEFYPFEPDPLPDFSSNVSLYNTILKLGLATNFNEKWSGTFVVLPKLASDYQDLSGDDFYIGGVALLKFQKNENIRYKVGWYAMEQAFGVFTTPVIGFYYSSPDKKLEMDVSLPVSLDANYKIGKNTKVGFNYYAIGRSFEIHKKYLQDRYVDYSALEFTGYFEYGFMENTVLLRLKAGLASNNAEVYATNDKIDFRISAFDIGDDRTQLNTDLSSSLFAKVEAVYRFDLSDK